MAIQGIIMRQVSRPTSTNHLFVIKRRDNNTEIKPYFQTGTSSNSFFGRLASLMTINIGRLIADYSIDPDPDPDPKTAKV